MKKLGVAIVISLFLIGFVMAISISPTGYTTNNNSEQDNENDSSEQDNENGLVNSSSQESDDENETDTEDELNEEESEEKTTITAEIKGSQSEVKIKKEFSTTFTTKEEIFSEIITKFALNKETADALLKIEETDELESNDAEEEKLQVEIKVREKIAEVEVELKFVLNTTEREKILDAVVEKSQITKQDILNALKFKVREKIKNTISDGKCPEECTCTGSTIKCQLASGREMIVIAGKSGNVIVQIKGVNMSTNVTLYKGENGTLYGMFKGKEKRIKLLPDQVRERIKEKIRARLENESITLDENGTYDYDGEKKAKLFFIIPVKVLVQAEIDPETGKVLEIKNSWWSFLAKDDNEEQIVGAGCGTVTPGQNDACCQNKEYDFWNATASECQFNSSQ